MFVGVNVGVASSRNKLALLTRLRNLNLRAQFSSLIVSEIYVHIYDFLKFVGLVGVKVGVSNFFWSIDSY